MTEPLDRPPAELEEDLRRDTSRFQWVALILNAVAVFVSILIGFAVLWSLMILRDATGEDAEARQAAAIEGLVVRIDCRQRDTLQSVIDGLVDQGLLEPGSVRVILDDCKAFASTTTTTEERP